jgi:ferrous iron transport protein A
MIASAVSGSILPIEHLKVNENASVVDVVGDASEVHRLSEMGLHHGARIRIVRAGSPCLMALDGKRLSVRLSGNVDIYVSPGN